MPCFVGAATTGGIAAGVAAGAATRKALKSKGCSEFEQIVGSSLASGAAHTAAAGALIGADVTLGNPIACTATGAIHTAVSFITQSAVAVGKKLAEAV